MILVRSKLATSKIHGIGLFAEEFIPKNTKVWEFNEKFDLVLTLDDTEKLSEAAKEQFFHYAYKSKETGNYILCSDDSRFFNHKTGGNVICMKPENAFHKESLVCFANKDILKGEELTHDYSEFDADPKDVT